MTVNKVYSKPTSLASQDFEFNNSQSSDLKESLRKPRTAPATIHPSTLEHHRTTVKGPEPELKKPTLLSEEVMHAKGTDEAEIKSQNS